MTFLADLVLVVIVTAHLLAVGVASFGPLAACALHGWALWRQDTSAAARGLELERLAAWALAAAVLLGLAAMAAVWLTYPTAWYRAAAIVPPRRVWFAVVELIFSLALIWWDVALWRRPAPPRWYQRAGWLVLPLVAGTNLVYHFPTLFAVIGVWSTRSEMPSPAEFRLAMIEPETMLRTAHHWLTGVIVTAVTLAATTWHTVALVADPLGARRMMRWGAWLALVGSALQVVIGLVLLTRMPRVAQDRLLGGDAGASAVFVLSIALTIGLLYYLATMCLVDIERRHVTATVALTVAVIGLMVATRHNTRRELWRKLEIVPQTATLQPPADRVRD